MTVASRTDPVRARGTSQTADSRFLGLDPDVYSYEACSKGAAAVNSEKGKELDRRLREYCASPRHLLRAALSETIVFEVFRTPRAEMERHGEQRAAILLKYSH